MLASDQGPRSTLSMKKNRGRTSLLARIEVVQQYLRVEAVVGETVFESTNRKIAVFVAEGGEGFVESSDLGNEIRSVRTGASCCRVDQLWFAFPAQDGLAGLGAKP